MLSGCPVFLLLRGVLKMPRSSRNTPETTEAISLYEMRVWLVSRDLGWCEITLRGE